MNKQFNAGFSMEDTPEGRIVMMENSGYNKHMKLEELSNVELGVLGLEKYKLVSNDEERIKFITSSNILEKTSPAWDDQLDDCRNYVLSILNKILNE